jgi:hypothetical protein
MKKTIIFCATLLILAAVSAPSPAQVSAKPDAPTLIEKMKQKHLNKNKRHSKKISGTVRKPSALPTPGR